MDIMDNFDMKKWVKADANQEQGYSLYRVVRHLSDLSSGDIAVYAVFDHQGDLRRVQFAGVTCQNPLMGVSNISLKLDEKRAGLDHVDVLGITLEEDCLERAV